MKAKDIIEFMDSKGSQNFYEMATLPHELSREAGWYTDLETGEEKPVDVAAKLMLVVSELGEALEGDRKGLYDEHLPEYPAFEVELADTIIRLLDLRGNFAETSPDKFLHELCERLVLRRDFWKKEGQKGAYLAKACSINLEGLRESEVWFSGVLESSSLVYHSLYQEMGGTKEGEVVEFLLLVTAAVTKAYENMQWWTDIALILIFGFCEWQRIDIEKIMVEKMKYNATRADHKLKNRMQGGKKY